MTTAAGEERKAKLDPSILPVVAVVLLGPFMTQLDSTVVNVSLSAIRDDLHSSTDSAQWIVSGYLLALALMLPLNGWLVDRIGAKRLYLVCFSLFAVTSVACGASRSMPALIGARVCQGIAGGLLAPLTQLMMARVAGKQMARVLGYAVVPVLVAPILGPVLAGAILKSASWPWVFYVNLPVGIFAVTLAAWLLPRDGPSLNRRPFDTLGFLLISPGLVALLYGLERAAHGRGVAPLVLGAVLLGGFALHARRARSSALIDLRLFESGLFANAAVTMFLVNGMLYASQFLVPLYLVTGAGLSPERVGWLLAPAALAMLFVYPMVGTITDRFGCRRVVASGVVLTVLGTVPFVWMTLRGFTTAGVELGLFLRSVGQGAIGIPTVSAAYASVAKEKLSAATTAVNIVQRLGGPMATIAIAIAVTFATARVSGESAFLVPFLALMSIQVLSLGCAVRLPLRIGDMR
ncbi:MAG TPA: DHA2 family efflux MFS transporter permease subunit [Polyangiaceae bacterium]|nr:DHA2 family efflux MFS transporter permease subunit [Polyangiaceae bacterium]